MQDYISKARLRLFPFREINKMTPPLIVNKTAANFVSSPVDDFYVEVQDEIKFRKIDKIAYNMMLSFPISEAFYKDGEIKFLINNKNYSTFDIKYFILSGYIYIMHKPSFVINNITFIYKKNDVGYIEDNNKNVSNMNPDDTLTLNIQSPDYPEMACILGGVNKKLIVLNNGESLWDKYISDKDNFLSNIYDVNPVDVYMYNEDTGFDYDLTKVMSSPLYIKNISTNPKDKLIIVSDTTPLIKNSLYFKELNNLFYDKKTRAFRDDIYNYFNADVVNRFIPQSSVSSKYDSDFSDAKELLFEARDFNWDLYYSLTSDRFRTNIATFKEKIVYSNKLDTLAPAIRASIFYPSENYLKISFHNNRKLLPEIYFRGRKFIDNRMVEKFGAITTVAIKEDSFMKYYGITDIKEIDHIYIVLKPEEFIEYDYLNIEDEYNGVVPIGRKYFNMREFKLYNNGYLQKQDQDIAFNTLPPTNLLVGFPKRVFPWHRITATGYLAKDIYKKKMKLKFRNFTSTEESDILNKVIYDKYIYKNLLATEYVDNNTQIFCGPYLLMEDVDYIVLSSTLILIIGDLFRYKEDDMNTDFIELKIENHFYSPELSEFKNCAYKSSWLKKLFEIPEIKKELIKSSGEVSVKNERDNNDCPEYYREDEYRSHMMLTKYLCTEIVLTDDSDLYGDKWLNGFKFEFPEAWYKENGKDILDYEGLIDKSLPPLPLDKIVRPVTLPPSTPLNLLIAQDIVAKRKLIRDGHGNYTTERANEKMGFFFNKSSYENEAYINLMIRKDVQYRPSIPFDAIFIKEEEVI